MTEAQKEDLLIEWRIYDDQARQAMVDEYEQLRKSQNIEYSFLDFLKEKLEIEGYWKKIGLV